MSTTEPAEPDPEGTRLAELLGSALGGPVIDAEATGDAGLGDDPSRDLTTGPDGSRGHVTASWRERAEAAERKLAAIEAYCRTRPEMAGAGFPQMAGDILAIIGTDEKGGAPYDRDFAGPVL